MYKPEATKDVLPFATGLVGFLGGLVTAMFGASEGRRVSEEAQKAEDSKNKPKEPTAD